MRRFAFLLLFSTAAFAADPPKQFFNLHDLGSGVWAAIGIAGSGAGSNAGFIIGDDGVIVVDTFQSVDAAKQLLAAIKEKTTLPVRFVINTHYHLDHVAGNGVFSDAGARILAQRNVRAWERTENMKFFGATPAPDKKAWVESLTLPDVVYDDAVDLYLGQRKVQVRYMLGHTGGDSVVSIPDANVVFMGDLFWNTTLPNTIDGDTVAWMQTDERVATDFPKAAFVPGHGEVGNAQDVTAFRGYLQALQSAVASARKNNLTGDALLAAVKGELAPRYEQWGFYKNFLDRNIKQADEEQAGTKRRPPRS